MSPVPASAITIADGEITIDAELLAPKLGLSAEALTKPFSRLATLAPHVGAKSGIIGKSLFPVA